MLAISKQHNLQNTVLREDRFRKTDVLYAHLVYKRHTVRGRPHEMLPSVSGMGRSTNSVAWKLES